MNRCEASTLGTRSTIHPLPFFPSMFRLASTCPVQCAALSPSPGASSTFHLTPSFGGRYFAYVGPAFFRAASLT